MYQRLLRERGDTVTVATTAAAALTAARRTPYDLILCDLALDADIDGYTIARRLRRSRTHRHTRLIAVSGFSADTDRARSHTAGFDAHQRDPLATMRATEGGFAAMTMALRQVADECCRGWLALEDAPIGAQIYGGVNDGQPTGCPDMPLYERVTQLASWEECNGAGKVYIDAVRPSHRYSTSFRSNVVQQVYGNVVLIDPGCIKAKASVTLVDGPTARATTRCVSAPH